MNDMLMDIYNKLATSTIIDNKRIKFYETPENMDLNSAPFIVISPLAPPEPSYYGSDDELAMEMTYQVNVEATKLYSCSAHFSMYSVFFFRTSSGSRFSLFFRCTMAS